MYLLFLIKQNKGKKKIISKCKFKHLFWIKDDPRAVIKRQSSIISIAPPNISQVQAPMEDGVNQLRNTDT